MIRLGGGSGFRRILKCLWTVLRFFFTLILALALPFVLLLHIILIPWEIFYNGSRIYVYSYGILQIDIINTALRSRNLIGRSREPPFLTRLRLDLSSKENSLVFALFMNPIQFKKMQTILKRFKNSNLFQCSYRSNDETLAQSGPKTRQLRRTGKKINQKFRLKICFAPQHYLCKV